MLFLSFSRPLSRDKLSETAAAFYRLREKLRRRWILSAVCSPLCFLLHTGLMILTSVGMLYRYGGAENTAVLDTLPYLPQVLNACFQTLPKQLGLRFEMPELLGLAAAILLPPLVCMLAALPVRIGLKLGRKAPAVPEALSPEDLLGEVKTLHERSGKSRKANWTLFSALVSLLAFAAAFIFCLYIIRPERDDLNIKYIMSYLFIALLAFSMFHILATLTDMLLGELAVYDIVNVFRPMSESPEKILKLMREMEGFARQTVTGFVNNSNLLNWASSEDLRRGYVVIAETSRLSGLPVVHTTGRPELLAEFLADGRDPRYIGEPIPLETYMHRSWEAFTREGF